MYSTRAISFLIHFVPSLSPRIAGLPARRQACSEPILAPISLSISSTPGRKDTKEFYLRTGHKILAHPEVSLTSMSYFPGVVPVETKFNPPSGSRRITLKSHLPVFPVAANGKIFLSSQKRGRSGSGLGQKIIELVPTLPQAKLSRNQLLNLCFLIRKEWCFPQLQTAAAAKELIPVPGVPTESATGGRLAEHGITADQSGPSIPVGTTSREILCTNSAPTNMAVPPNLDNEFRTDGEKILFEEILLPFTVHSPCEAYPYSLPSGGLDTINHVAADVWKALRMAQTKTSGPQDLSIFPRIHWDIMLEVLGHLHPLDLDHVSRTNKSFREVLHSPVADSIWRKSFTLDEELPTAPAQIPARRWSKLLFGPQICDECGAPNTLPDYIIWRRLCTACMEQKLSATVPGYDESDEVNTLVPRTMRGVCDPATNFVTQSISRYFILIPSAGGRSDWARRKGWEKEGVSVARSATRSGCHLSGGTTAVSTSRGANRLRCIDTQHAKGNVRGSNGAIPYDWGTQPQGRFWASEGKAIAEIYEHYKSGDDPTALRRFIQSRHLIVDDIKTIGKSSYEWAENLRAEAESHSYKRRCRLTGRRRAVKRLISEGWEMVDIKNAYITGCKYLGQIQRLTSKRWNKIRPYIVAMVEQANEFRLARSANNCCNVYIARSRHRAETRMLPPPHAIYSFPPLEQLLNDPSFEPLDPEDPRLHAALTEAAAFVDSWCAENQALLTSLLPDSRLDSRYPPDPNPLARATSIFRCPARVRTGIAIGWEEARTHLHWFRGRPPMDTRTVEFCERGSATAHTLATLLDMDPETVTAAVMGEANARFVCGHCPPGRDALRWRECVLHDVAENDRNLASHFTPSWLLLSPLATLDVHRREGQDNYSALLTWSCGLCDAHFPQCTTYTIALRHARSDHGIESPIEGIAPADAAPLSERTPTPRATAATAVRKTTRVSSGCLRCMT
ncbi:hypothetical protein B0H11DRAFT_2372831 [Mycena galericulata]|nr:hypothetical protein B0H11DRAFT_2372831 [Mycena galericulata]